MKRKYKVNKDTRISYFDVASNVWKGCFTERTVIFDDLDILIADSEEECVKKYGHSYVGKYLKWDFGPKRRGLFYYFLVISH